MHWTRRSRNSSTRIVQGGIRTLFFGGLIMCLALLTIGCGSGGGGNSDTDAPSAPTNLTGSSGDAIIDLDWDGVGAGDLDGYNVYRATDTIKRVSNRDPRNESLLSETVYTDNNVQNGTTYFYVVTAVDDAGNESAPHPNPNQGDDAFVKTPFPPPETRP